MMQLSVAQSTEDILSIAQPISCPHTSGNEHNQVHPIVMQLFATTIASIACNTVAGMAIFTPRLLKIICDAAASAFTQP